MPKKNLFIVDWFVHGGAEREMFELDRGLKQNNIEIDILCLKKINTDDERSDFFYEKHLALGTTIYFIDDIVFENLSIKQKILNRINRSFFKAYKASKIENFVESYDHVFFMGEYVYKQLENILTPSMDKKIPIFVMSARFQGEYFRDFNKKNNYLFISGYFTTEEIEYEFENFLNYSHLFFPLNLEVKSTSKKWKFNETKSIKRIGIFTRLSSAKPLDPFFYALHIMLLKNPHIELNIYGGGAIEDSGYTRYINHLGMSDKVFFKGHQDDIKATILNEELDLVWFQGYLNRPAGYAGFDVALTGTPQLFWDFYLGENSRRNDVDAVYPHFKNIVKFADHSLSILMDADSAESLSQKQFEDVVNNRNMQRNIKEIIHLFQ